MKEQAVYSEILPPGSTGADLQAAIDRAVFGDVIQISSDMTFENTVSIRAGLEITLQSSADNGRVMYQSEPDMRHFEINGSLILENITLDGNGNSGGVQLTLGAFAMLDGAVIQNCFAENGGGVEVSAGTFSIYGGEIKNNTAENGGGVYINAGFFNMSAPQGDISSNKAANGGGVYINSGTYSFTGGSVADNEAVNGGGIYVSTSANLSITQSGTISENRALTGSGGGIYTESADYSNITTGSNVTFMGNRAPTAYNPPENAAILYPQIQYARTSVSSHPLNNFDINYTGSTIITFRLRYVANGGAGSYTDADVTPGSTYTVLTSEATGILRKGYTFAGWNTSSNGRGTRYLPGNTIILMENITLYAQWTAVLYTVTYSANGGVGYYVEKGTPDGTRYAVLSPDATGISFVSAVFTGWNTRQDGQGIQYSPGDEIIITTNVMLYAQWVAAVYTVTYNANGGIGLYEEKGIPRGTEYTLLSPAVTGICCISYTFVEWNTRPDGRGTKYSPGDTIIITENVTLYARWTPNCRPCCTDYCSCYKEYCGMYCDTRFKTCNCSC